MTAKKPKPKPSPKLVPVSTWILERAFETLDQKDIDEILKRTREIDEHSYQRLKELARKVKSNPKQKD